MSTDLQLRQDLLQIRLPAIKTTPPKQSSDAPQETTSTLLDDFTGEDECSTPTSAEHRIPAVFSCPPAPKKQRFEPACSCKRKLSCEFQFYEIISREEIEEFFRSGFEVVNRNSKRRRPL